MLVSEIPVLDEAEGRPLRILIAGGGLSGLCLAHGLVRDGHDVYVFERDADFTQRSGYMLSINGDGGEALRACLPSDLFEVYAQTSARTSDRHGTVVLASDLTLLSAMEHLGAPNLGDRPHTGVHRRALWQILRSHLDGVLVTGAAVVSFEQDENRVLAIFSDGTTVEGDLLVGADGIRSAVRAQLLPDATVVEAGIDGIGVYGRSPLTADIVGDIPEVLIDDVTIVADRAGHRVLLGPLRARQSVADATSGVAGVDLDPFDDYVMVSCSVEHGTVVPPNREWTAETPRELRDSMLRAIEGWHPSVRAIVERIDLDSLFMIPFGRLEPIEPWQPSRVTLVGDAAHAMLPTLGMGANLALLDAARLADAVTEAHRSGAPLVDLVGRAEAEMRDYVYPFMRMTVEHDKHFGGGGLSELSVAQHS